MVSCLSIKFTSSLSPFCPWAGGEKDSVTAGASLSPSGRLSRVGDLMVRSGVAAVPHCSWCHVAPGHMVSAALQLPSEAWGGKSILEFPPSTSPEAPHQPQGGSQRKEQVLTRLNRGDQLLRFPGLPPPPSPPRGCTQTLSPVLSLFSTAGEF